MHGRGWTKVLTAKTTSPGAPAHRSMYSEMRRHPLGTRPYKEYLSLAQATAVRMETLHFPREVKREKGALIDNT